MRVASGAKIQEFADEVREIFGDRLDRVVLYGSYARGEELPGSDIDVAIILDEVRGDERDSLKNLLQHYLLDEELDFSPKFFQREEFERRAGNRESFYRNVEEEGIEV